MIARKVVPGSIVSSDGWRGYNALDASDFKHFSLNHFEFLQAPKIISPKSKIFGTQKSAICENSTVFQRCFWCVLKECDRRFYNSAPSTQ